MSAKRSGKKPKAADVTPWFAMPERPARRGSYEVMTETSLPYPFHYWDGETWSTPEKLPSRRGARNDHPGYAPEQFYLDGAKWRGLSKPPQVSSRKRATK